MRTLSLALALLLPGWLTAAPPADTLLYRTDFSRLAPGAFAQYAEPGFPEYHHADREFTDGWEVVNNRGPEEWKVLEPEPGVKVLDYLAYNTSVWTYDFTYPIIVTGDPLWRDYALEVELTPHHITDLNGIVFRYRDGRHYYLFGILPGDSLTLRYRDGEKDFRSEGWHELARAALRLDPTRPVLLRAEADGDRLRCLVDGRQVFAVTDKRYDSGKVGLFATSPIRFHRVAVSATPARQAAFLAAKTAEQAELDSLRRLQPRPKLWKRIDTRGFGAARALRLGDLDGDGETDFLLVQNVPFFGGNYNMISCLTALRADGGLLWQQGTPDPDHAWVTYDVAAQIHDIDDDGQAEVICARDRWLLVLDGRTGKEEARWQVPLSAIQPGETSWDEYDHYYRRDHLPFLNVDCISFCDLRGAGKPLDMLIKDRHTRLWAFTNKFEPLWTASANLGHFPYFIDWDHDGRDEVFIGYTLFDHDGKVIWSNDDKLQEHADGVVAAAFDPRRPQRRAVFIGASDDGVVMLDEQGKITLHDRVGHAQTPSVGNFRPDRPGLEFCNVNYWGEPGLITLYGCDGVKLNEFEPFHAGSPVMPVNWRGDGAELIMLSASTREGGLLDGQGRRVVMLPEDGHPHLAYTVHDLTGDPRDELVVWDPAAIWIYTQDRVFEGDSIYAPVRPRLCNESNYGVPYSFPGWKKPAR